MDLKQLYNEILTEHNQRPSHEGIMEQPDLVLQGVNPSCGDDYTLQLKMDGDTVADGMFTGSGCAVSKASVDMMLELIIGKSKDDAIRCADIFQRMIKGQAQPQELDELEDAAILESVSHMPARVKCAVLGWRTAQEMLEKH